MGIPNSIKNLCNSSLLIQSKAFLMDILLHSHLKPEKILAYLFNVKNSNLTNLTEVQPTVLEVFHVHRETTNEWIN
jgi:hypothetical protein